MKVILCCGDRSWSTYSKIFKELKKEHEKDKIDYVIEGGATGADYQSKQAALNLGIQVVECPANWNFYQKAAGPIRNQKQLELLLLMHNITLLSDSPTCHIEVIAFHSDIKSSKGTKDMVARAKKAGVKVRIIK